MLWNMNIHRPYVALDMPSSRNRSCLLWRKLLLFHLTESVRLHNPLIHRISTDAKCFSHTFLVTYLVTNRHDLMPAQQNVLFAFGALLALQRCLTLWIS